MCRRLAAYIINKYGHGSSQPKSYAIALKGNDLKLSILHFDVTEIHPDADSTIKTVNTRIYCSSRTEGAYFFDISYCFPHFTEKQVIIMSKEQHPNAHSCISSKMATRNTLNSILTKKTPSAPLGTTCPQGRSHKI
jgi:hypothetical protein